MKGRPEPEVEKVRSWSRLKYPRLESRNIKFNQNHMLRNGFMGFNRFKVVKLFNFLEFILTFSRSRLLKISGAGASFFLKPLEPGPLTIVAEVVSKLTGSETRATKIIFILQIFFFCATCVILNFVRCLLLTET